MLKAVCTLDPMRFTLQADVLLSKTVSSNISMLGTHYYNTVCCRQTYSAREKYITRDKQILLETNTGQKHTDTARDRQTLLEPDRHC